MSIWFNCVLRGDVAPIKISANTNIQDGTVIHTSRFKNGSTFIGKDVTVGHLALIHAATILNNAFIGMRATVMDNVVVEQYGFVAAGSVVTPGKVVKEYELWVGVPAKYVRKVTDEELRFMQDNIETYKKLATHYKSCNE